MTIGLRRLFLLLAVIAMAGADGDETDADWAHYLNEFAAGHGRYDIVAMSAAEAGHASLFVALARELFPEEDVGARLAAWTAREAELIRGLAFAPRVHSGPPPPAGPAASSSGSGR